jgi:hypothetical protein
MAGTLIGHGFYPRHPLETTRRYVIGIKRWYCRACHTTTSLLPSFLLRFRWYEAHLSWTQVTARCAVEGAPSNRTIGRWGRSFTRYAPVWLSAVEETLAEQDPASPLLDPLGATANSRSVPAALLQAALHLLAWAKTHWANLTGHGPADRLRFLWHWGYGRGLARLI